jgi:hypothetical protein
MDIKKTKEHLKCVLTEQEFKQYSSTLARTYSEIQELEEARKSVASDFKGKIDGSTAEATRLARIIQNGYEFRYVECDVVYMLITKTVGIVRNDTGEVVSTRPMTDEERQTVLPFKDPDEVSIKTPKDSDWPGKGDVDKLPLEEDNGSH